jgi:hypothetical protein
VRLDWRNVHRKLYSNSRDKLASIAGITTASREEEAGCKPALLEVVSCDRVCNRRLSCAGHTAQPKKALLVFAIRPL